MEIQNKPDALNAIPFDINNRNSEYDQNTYRGRLMLLLKTQNPFNFFLPHSKIVHAKEIIEEEIKKARSGKLNYYDEERIKEIRSCQYILDSAVHPDTGEYIPRLFRLCAYAPMGIPILYGFLLSSPTTFNIVFWQWINQTFSAGVNYANRNASSNLDTKGILVSYTAACCASIGIGLGTKKVLEPYSKKVKGSGSLFINFFISLAAVGSAGFINLLIMRSREMKEGIMLVDHEGIERGKSSKIGRKAVLTTAFTRFIMPIPPLLLPTLAFYYLENRSMIPKNKIAKLSLETIVFFGSLGIAPPLACALFKQSSSSNVSSLEKEFHNLKDSKGNKITELYYNKGL